MGELVVIEHSDSCAHRDKDREEEHVDDRQAHTHNSCINERRKESGTERGIRSSVGHTGTRDQRPEGSRGTVKITHTKMILKRQFPPLLMTQTES